MSTLILMAICFFFGIHVGYKKSRMPFVIKTVETIGGAITWIKGLSKNKD